MRGDQLIHTQLLMAQGFNALADSIANSRGVALTPVPLAALPVDPPPTVGTLMCIEDSDVTGSGEVITGGGTSTVIAWFDGASWKVLGA